MEKNLILDSIKTSRAAMRVVNKCITTFPELSSICYAIIETEQENIKKMFDQLVELNRGEK